MSDTTHDDTIDADDEIDDAADDAGDADTDALLDLVNDEPDILATMAHTTMAVDAITRFVNTLAQQPGELGPLVAGVQEILLAHGIMAMRTPERDEIDDPEWWGHAAGVTADTPVCVQSDQFMHAAASLVETIGLDDDPETEGDTA